MSHTYTLRAKRFRGFVFALAATATLAAPANPTSARPAPAPQQGVKVRLIPAGRLTALRALHEARVGRAIAILTAAARARAGSARGSEYWLKVMRTARAGADTFSISTHRPETAAPRRIYLVTYDIESGLLVSWSSVVVDAALNTETETRTVDYRGPGGETLVATAVTVRRDAKLSELVRTPSKPAGAGDAPPASNPDPLAGNVAKVPRAGALTQITAPVIPADRLARLREIHQARAGEVIRALTEELREGTGVEKIPGLADGGLRRTDPNIPSGLPSLGGRQSPFDSALGDLDRGITDRVRQPKPRSTVVGPAELPRDNSGLVSAFPAVTVGESIGSGCHTTSIIYRDPLTGASVGSHVVTYETGTGRLIGWKDTRVDRMGNSTTESNTVDYRGPTGDTPVVVSEKTKTSGNGEETSTTDPVERPLEPSDPPVTDPNPQPAASTRTVTGEETVGGRGPLGMECNFITGQCAFSMELGASRTNPGPDGQTTLVGPRLNLNQESTVINPSPDSVPGRAQPRPIDQPRITPGARPPGKKP